MWKLRPLRVVCVIGMHRSGTSVVARFLNLLGVSLGPEEQLLEPAPHNPAGFWENERIIELNDELLATLGGNATTPRVLADGWEQAEELDRLRERAADVLASISHGVSVLGLKDPRLTLTLPFWRTVTPIAHVVHCLRDPVEAVPSFVRWHPLDLEVAGRLWLRYVVSGCRTGEQVLVRFDDVMAEPQEVARRIAASLGLPEPAPQTLAAIAETVDTHLHRFRGATDFDGQLDLAALLYRQLVDGGPAAAGPLVELLHRYWLAEDELCRTRESAEETRVALEELAAAERALRGRLAVRAALRLAQPAGPLLRRLRGRSRATPVDD